MAGLLSVAAHGMAAPGLGAPGLGAPAAEPRFAALRQDLVLEPGPRGRNGAPSWTLQDPARGRFHRLGWLEYEMLCRWHLGTPSAIAEAVAAETTLRPQALQVEHFARFLAGANLLVATGPGGTSRLLRQAAARRSGALAWLLHNYLFFRIPLIRPDAALGRLARTLGFVFTRGFALVTLLAGLLGIFLASRQWDAFGASFLHFFSVEGALLGVLSLVLAKALHELGHGLTAKRFGCRVPTMGVAFMLLYPMAYTDASEAWRLPDRRQRLAVGAAGIAAELALACWALLAWNLLPDGPLRSVAFTWATTTWLLTVAVNLSPFMRFDGYYLLSDALDVPNLQDRAFALTRWRLREILFGLGEPAPEAWTRQMQRILIGWSVCTWIYRFLLFVGIALLVYHMAFKALGLLLFAVEIWWFIARPVMAEFRAWIARRGRIRLSPATLRTLAGASLLLLLTLVPWRSTVDGPALLVAERHALVYAAVPGQVESIAARVGDRVEEGQRLLRLAAPELDHRRTLAQRRAEALEGQVAALGQDRDYVARSQLLFRELQAARAEERLAAAELARLDPTAPFGGVVVALADPIAPGEWMPRGEAVAEIIDPRGARVDAYVEEADLRRVAAGARAVFVPETPSFPRIALRLVAIDDGATRVLVDAELGSAHGGTVATRPQQNGALVPELTLYRLRLEPLEAVTPRQVQRGTVLIEGEAESLAARAWRQLLGLMLRESGF